MNSSGSGNYSTSHELFSLAKLISVGREARGGSKSSKVEIRLVAVGGYVGNAFIALSCSNGESEATVSLTFQIVLSFVM
jgi:hypothetical protein